MPSPESGYSAGAMITLVVALLLLTYLAFHWVVGMIALVVRLAVIAVLAAAAWWAYSRLRGQPRA